MVRNQVEIGMDFQEPLLEGSAVSLSAFGYRPDVPFSALPKLELRIEPLSYAVRDQGRLLPRSRAWASARGKRLTARIPLSSLGDPRRLFLQVRTSSPRTPLGQTPWWIVELRDAIQSASVDRSPGSSPSASAFK
jgi:hypothetical protein